jgi:hypothetical protein
MTDQVLSNDFRWQNVLSLSDVTTRQLLEFSIKKIN